MEDYLLALGADEEKKSSEGFENQLATLDSELKTICFTFHTAPGDFKARKQRLQTLATGRQEAVNRILNEILDEKKCHHKYVLDAPKKRRPADLCVPVISQTAEGLLFAARIANKPFKQTVQALAQEIHLPPDQVMVGPVKGIDGIKRKFPANGTPKVFDLNRATFVFKDRKELKSILEAIFRHFQVVYLLNKFAKQWDNATEPPCLHLNVYLKRESYPVELLALLTPNSLWVAELQLTMQDFLNVKARCHPIYELLRLPKENSLPRACPVCGLFETFVDPLEITKQRHISRSQKVVRRGRWGEQDVAYNIIACNTTEVASYETRFLQEVQIITKLQHPNILNILGVVRSADSLGFITEWIADGSLSSCLSKLKLGQEWDVVLQVCQSLMYLHDHDVVHYDLKSANILCSFETLTFKICDFGLSHTRASTMPADICVGGSPNWRAPETWGKVDKHHPAADVYSFGCLLIELFSELQGRKHVEPWRDVSEKLIQKRVTSRQKPPELYYVNNPRVKKVAEACLAFDPEVRPSIQKVYKKLVAARKQIEMDEWWTSLKSEQQQRISSMFVDGLTEDQFRWAAVFLAKQPWPLVASHEPQQSTSELKSKLDATSVLMKYWQRSNEIHMASLVETKTGWTKTREDMAAQKKLLERTQEALWESAQTAGNLRETLQESKQAVEQLQENLDSTTARLSSLRKAQRRKDKQYKRLVTQGKAYAEKIRELEELLAEKTNSAEEPSQISYDERSESEQQSFEEITEQEDDHASQWNIPRSRTGITQLN